MNGKRFSKVSISLTLVLLIIVGTFQVLLDPLYQYHQPWFGLRPIFTNERYHNAGVAKSFYYENVVVGNSLAGNFDVADVEKAFGGKTVKLTANGSQTKDWTYLLDILRKKNPKTILINLDPYVMNGDPEKLIHVLPIYLYDENLVNDVNYLFNFSVIGDFSYDIIRKNRSNGIMDFNNVFVWNEQNTYKTSREEALKHYNRPEKGEKLIDTNALREKALANMNNLAGYYNEMKETKFVFFCSPISILFWDRANQNNDLGAWREAYIAVFESLTKYDNVSVYFWTDQEMLNSICDLDNYVDEAHYGVGMCRIMCKKMAAKDGLINTSNYIDKINRFFNFLETYDYDSLFDT